MVLQREVDDRYNPVILSLLFASAKALPAPSTSQGSFLILKCGVLAASALIPAGRVLASGARLQRSRKAGRRLVSCSSRGLASCVRNLLHVDAVSDGARGNAKIAMLDAPYAVIKNSLPRDRDDDSTFHSVKV
eukprot:5877180-Pleurochrysis_carterae.AAC.1